MSNETILDSTTTITIISTQSTSISGSDSSLIGFLWFDTIAACFAYGLGFLGNLLSLIVFYSQPEFRKISTGLLFLFISISNFFHLFTLAVEFLTNYNIIVFHNVILQCRLNFFVQNVSRAMSTYFMVTISIDRLIRSEFPMRSKRICTKRNIILITLIYLIIFCIFWSFYLYPFSSQDPIAGTCSYTQSASYYYFLINIHVPVRAVFVCFIPVLIMVSTNIRMLMNIRQSRRRIETTQVSDGNLPGTHASRLQNKAKRQMSALDRMLYYMMIANVSIFIITQIPFHIYSCIRYSLTGLDTFTASLIRALLLSWSSLYFGIGFYFYCLAAPLFRQKFVKIIKRILCQQVAVQSATNTPATIG